MCWQQVRISSREVTQGSSPWWDVRAAKDRQTPSGDRVLTVMEPVQPFIQWITLGKLPRNPGFPIREMAMITVPAVWSCHMDQVCT